MKEACYLFETESQELAIYHFKKVQKYIAKGQEEFLEHPFFSKITQEQSLDKFIVCAELLSFWVMTFQDLLRLNLSYVTNENAFQILKRHLIEDKGHDSWFLQDLETMKVAEPTLSVIYGQNHTFTRDATYALVSEVFRLHNDYERIILLLTLESAGHVFFNSTANLIEKLGKSKNFKYFSFYHLSIEKNHDILLEQKIEEYIKVVSIPVLEVKNLLSMIDRVYEAFTSMFNGLVALM